jgi:hypothetical protein
MNKHQTYARSRMPGRAERHGLARRSSADLAAARQVAIHFVADRWPALADVDPEVSLAHSGQEPSPVLIARLGLSASEVGHHDTTTAAYTFTFASQCGMADGAVAPLVAAVTVDTQRRIVKTSLSK